MNPPAAKSVTRSVSKDRLRLWLRLLRTTRCLENELRNRFRGEFETTLPRFDLMAALYRQEKGLTMTELSRALMVSNGNVTGLVDRLVEDGSVRRSAIDGDRRAIRVGLTAKGRASFEAQAKSHEVWINGLLGSIKQQETANMIRLLAKVGEAEGDTKP